MCPPVAARSLVSHEPVSRRRLGRRRHPWPETRRVLPSGVEARGVAAIICLAQAPSEAMVPRAVSAEAYAALRWTAVAGTAHDVVIVPSQTPMDCRHETRWACSCRVGAALALKPESAFGSASDVHE